MDNLEEMHRFLEKFNLPGLNQEEIKIMNKPTPNTKIETVIKSLSQKQKPRARWLNRGLLSNTQRQANAYFLKLFQKIAEEGTLPNSFNEATVTWIQKPGKDNTKEENGRPISLMNIDAKLLNKILANNLTMH